MSLGHTVMERTNLLESPVVLSVLLPGTRNINNIEVRLTLTSHSSPPPARLALQNSSSSHPGPYHPARQGQGY